MKCIPHLIKFISMMLMMCVLISCASKTASQKSGRQVDGFSAASNQSKFFRKKSSQRKIDENTHKKYQNALVQLKSGDLLHAEKLFKEVSIKYPDMAGPHINLGIISVREARWQDAEKHFREASAYSPNNPEVYNYLGVTYRQRGKFAEAKAMYLEAIQKDENFASAYLNLGILLDLYLSDYVLAKKYYQQYQAINPSDQNVKSWLLDLDQRIQASN